MIECTQLNSWAILPQKDLQAATATAATAAQYWLIVNPRNIIVYPNIVNEIKLGFSCTIPDGFTLNIEPYFGRTQWHVLGLDNNHNVTVYIITKAEIALKHGTIIARLILSPTPPASLNTHCNGFSFRERNKYYDHQLFVYKG